MATDRPPTINPKFPLEDGIEIELTAGQVCSHLVAAADRCSCHMHAHVCEYALRSNGQPWLTQTAEPLALNLRNYGSLPQTVKGSSESSNNLDAAMALNGRDDLRVSLTPALGRPCMRSARLPRRRPASVPCPTPPGARTPCTPTTHSTHAYHAMARSSLVQVRSGRLPGHFSGSDHQPRVDTARLPRSERCLFIQ